MSNKGMDNAASLEEGAATSNMVIEVTDIDTLSGNDIEEKVQSFIDQNGVVMFGKTYCPFCLDAKEFLSLQMGVKVHAIEIDTNTRGKEIHSIVIEKTKQRTVPVIFIDGKFAGGCDDIKSLHAKGQLEDMLKPFVLHKKTTGTKKLETAMLVPVSRGAARHPAFWFPNVVNNNVVRVTGFQVFCLSVLSAVFHEEQWGQYIAVALLVDFMLRMTVGSFLSPLGMIATFVTSPWRPNFKPGPPKQFAAFCGVCFSLLATIFYFVDFEGHEVVGAIIIAMLAGASGLEAFLDFCLGCVFFGLGIQFGLFPDSVYRIYTTSKQETEDSWDYMFRDSGAAQPEYVDTDHDSKIALKYKRKTDEWTKDDFNMIKNMQVTYFGMPLAIVGLSVAFKLASNYRMEGYDFEVVSDVWFEVFAVVGAVVFALMLVLYGLRAVMFPGKIATEWDCPLRSPSFGLITITFMLLAFVFYDEIDEGEFEENTRGKKFARVVFWIGAACHSLLTIAKVGEWIGRRFEMEHYHPSWMIMPVGLSVAALCGVTIPMFDIGDKDFAKARATTSFSRFFYAFAYLMWVTLFVLSFLKVVTSHNSDNRIRHGVFIWLAAPCVIGLANLAMCTAENERDDCETDFSNYYFIGIFLFLSFCWASLPHIRFFGMDEKFGMGYWTECFALDTLAACAAQYYHNNVMGHPTGDSFGSKILMFIGLTIAAIANMVALLHTLTGIVQHRNVFTPEVKWGPLSFMKLTHEAFRGNMEKLRKVIGDIDLSSESKNKHEQEANLGLFAAHFNRFVTVHEEHAKHEDHVIFKVFNDYFNAHAKVYNDDHAEDHRKLEEWRLLCNKLLDTDYALNERQDCLQTLKKELPAFFDHFLEHLKGEEDNLQPIGRKHLPLEIQKQISREAFRITSAEKWEIIIPYIVNNLPRHGQRVRYLKVLCWSMPERAQFIGAIIYRNVDAVMWERLRIEVPEIIPRGATNWKRYY